MVTGTVVDPAPNDTTWYFLHLVSVSATQAVFKVVRSTAIVILGISVLEVPAAVSGITVHMHAALAN